jgi:spermidine synthase
VHLPQQLLAVLALVPTAYVVTATQMALSARLVLLMPAFFVMCLACHTELAYLRPHPRNLSSFYLMIALGGAVGGIIAAVVAPLVFNSYHELPISLAACVILAVAFYARSRGWSWRHPLVIAPLLAAGVMVAYIVHDSLDELSRTRFATRNFYGTLSIVDEPAPDGMGPLRMLVDDSIKHGGQLQAPMYRRQPTTYFGPESGIGLALKAAGRRGPIRVGVLGLGAGTLAAYGRAGDVYVFFEINPLVIGMASTEFSFLRDTPATVEVLSGDGRLLLERYVGPSFDVLVIDAFAGDAVPVHLVTREAFELYVKRLAPEGILAMQVTNQYVDLKPIVRASASALALHAVLVTTDGQRPPFYNSTWVLLSPDAHRFEAPAFARARPLVAPPVTWTDDHASLLAVVKP